MKKIKLFYLAVILSFCALLIACPFDDSENKKDLNLPLSETNLSLSRIDELALLSMEPSIKVSAETLQSNVQALLNNDITGRTAGTTTSNITSVHEFTGGIPERFSFGTATDRALTIEEQEASQISFFVYNIENSEKGTNGFILASDDIRIGNILAIVEEGDWNDPDHPFLPVFYGNLHDYTLRTIQQYNSITEENKRTAVERYAMVKATQNARAIPGASVLNPYFTTPLTSATRWDQDNTYSYVINSTAGLPYNYFPAGCVATALAQIMAYHNKPAKPSSIIIIPGTSIPTYYIYDPYTNTNKLLLNLTYNWTDMKTNPNANNLDNDYKFMVGTLMLDIGTKCGMVYSNNGSGSNIAKAKVALMSMGYQEPQLLNYHINYVVASLLYGRPVYIRGESTSAGHAWVIDNFGQLKIDNTPLQIYLVYCNLGWSGANNGWYVSEIFDMVNGPVINENTHSYEPHMFLYNQQILANIRPF